MIQGNIIIKNVDVIYITTQYIPGAALEISGGGCSAHKRRHFQKCRQRCRHTHKRRHTLQKLSHMHKRRHQNFSLLSPHPQTSPEVTHKRRQVVACICHPKYCQPQTSPSKVEKINNKLKNIHLKTLYLF